jgi:predicted nucleotidyltransferase
LIEKNNGKRKEAMPRLTRDQVLQQVALCRPELEQMGVKSLRLFGSVARNEAREDSDLDFLVEFEDTPSLFELFEVRYFLEDLFKCRVDLGMEQSLREHLREPVLEDVIYAF